MPILTLAKQLTSKPESLELSNPKFEFRQFDVQAISISAWLQLRNLCFSTAGRAWNETDFQREFHNSGATNHQFRCFFVATSREQPKAYAGAICLQFSSNASESTTTSEPVNASEPAKLNWLMVRPDFRRQGVGVQLVRLAELETWSAGIRSLKLTTLTNWHAAVSLYEGLGYRSENTRN